MSQLELYKSLWSVKLYRLSGLHSSDENAVQKVAVIINQRLVQRSPKSVTTQRVILPHMRPKSAHASHCKLHRRNNRRVIHASLFAIRFITLFFQDKEFWRGSYSATTLQELSLCTWNQQFMYHQWSFFHNSTSTSNHCLVFCECYIENSTQRRTSWVYKRSRGRHISTTRQNKAACELELNIAKCADDKLLRNRFWPKT